MNFSTCISKYYKNIRLRISLILMHMNVILTFISFGKDSIEAICPWLPDGLCKSWLWSCVGVTHVRCKRAKKQSSCVWLLAVLKASWTDTWRTCNNRTRSFTRQVREGKENLKEKDRQLLSKIWAKNGIINLKRQIHYH